MTVKLDLYDQKIIHLLFLNSRESVTKISKKIKLSRDNTNYRINRLINKKIIKSFVTEFNENHLHIKHYIMFVQLTNLQSETETIILQDLKKNKYISWIGILAGKWTLVFDLFIPQKIKISEIINEILSKQGKYFGDYALLELERGDYFFEKLLNPNLNLNSSIKNPMKLAPTLDETDFKILFYLNKNPRINYAELSERIGLTANGIKNRIKLLQSHVIKKYSLTLDYKKFDYEWYGLQLKLSQYDEKTIKKINDFFKFHKNVIFYYKYLGQWDYDIGLIVKNSLELRNFINELRTKFSEELKIIDVFVTLEEIKNHQLPEGIFLNNF